MKQLVLEFEDNNLIRELLGEFDENLALIEDRLGIETHTNGNLITLSGSNHAIKTAKSVLEGLYHRLRHGEQITPAEVDGTIRHLDPMIPATARANASKKAPRKPSKKSSQRAIVKNGPDGAAQIKTKKRLITGRTKLQSDYLRTIDKNELTFSVGPAGTGKTYLAVAYASAALELGLIDRLILSRPAVEAGERLGFLPGDMREKIDPYLRPLYDALYDMLPAEKVELGLESGAIEIAPLAFMRGRTLSHALIILDEAQNCTPMQMKMFLTRLGEGSRMIVTGDPSQIDLPAGTRSGLIDATSLLQDVESIGQISFTSKDVVRHDLVTRIVNAYDNKDKKREEQRKKPPRTRNKRASIN
ncbi:MAG: PhoH family protein [bacterium]|nr:PhoH family protein [bacterium]